MVNCKSCGGEMVEIGLTIDDARLVMRSCDTCDVRSWHRDGEVVELHGLLADLSNTPTRYKRSLST